MKIELENGSTITTIGNSKDNIRSKGYYRHCTFKVICPRCGEVLEDNEYVATGNESEYEGLDVHELKCLKCNELFTDLECNFEQEII